MTNNDATTPDETITLRRDQLALLQITVFIVAICGIVYELLIAATSTYLIGNSVHQFSITIGLFMFAMGLGSYLSKLIRSRLLFWFVLTELSLALVGGLAAPALFLVYPFNAFYRPAMYALTIAIGALVGLEIPILTRILANARGVRRTLADVLSLDYFGALLGSLAFPLLLLPHLGLFRASFAIALLNLIVAAFNIIAFRRDIKRPATLAAAAVGVAAILLGGLLGAAWLTRFAEGQLFLDRIVLTRQTPYQRIVVTVEDATGLHALYLDGHVQFAEADEYRYHEGLVHPVMSQPTANADPTRILVLGGGDGLAVREILKYDSVDRIDLVDIDPAVTDIARTFAPLRRLNRNALADSRVHVHHDDAFTWLMDIDARFDRIIIDLPDPHNEALAKLYSVQFYRLARSRLTDVGRLVTQSSSPFFTTEAYWSVAATLEAAGFHVHSYHIDVPAFGDWGFHLASPDPIKTPLPLNSSVERRHLTPAVLEAASVFPADEQRPAESEINSIFTPTLYDLYRRGVERGR